MDMIVAIEWLHGASAVLGTHFGGAYPTLSLVRLNAHSKHVQWQSLPCSYNFVGITVVVVRMELIPNYPSCWTIIAWKYPT